MNYKTLRTSLLAAIFLFSCASFCYLNFNVAPAIAEAEDESTELIDDVQRTEVLHELAVIKVFGKKIIDVLIFQD